MQNIIGIIIVLALLGGGYYFFTQPSTSSDGDAMMEEHDDSMMEDGHDDAMMDDHGDAMMEEGDKMMDDGSMMEEGSMMMDGDVKVFTVDGGAFFFSPNTMSVKKGDTVRIVFKNVGGFHDFVIDEFNVATKQIQANQTDTVEFVADKTGTFEYYCSVGNHRQQGMVGTLTVE